MLLSFRTAALRRAASSPQQSCGDAFCFRDRLRSTDYPPDDEESLYDERGESLTELSEFSEATDYSDPELPASAQDPPKPAKPAQPLQAKPRAEAAPTAARPASRPPGAGRGQSSRQLATKPAAAIETQQPPRRPHAAMQLRAVRGVGVGHESDGARPCARSAHRTTCCNAVRHVCNACNGGCCAPPRRTGPTDRPLASSARCTDAQRCSQGILEARLAYPKGIWVRYDWSQGSISGTSMGPLWVYEYKRALGVR